MAKGTNAADLRGKNEEEIKDLLKTTRSKLFEARFQNYTNRLNDTSQPRKLRRELARLLTISGERRRAADKDKQPKAAAKAPEAKPVAKAEAKPAEAPKPAPAAAEAAKPGAEAKPAKAPKAPRKKDTAAAKAPTEAKGK